MTLSPNSNFIRARYAQSPNCIESALRERLLDSKDRRYTREPRWGLAPPSHPTTRATRNTYTETSRSGETCIFQLYVFPYSFISINLLTSFLLGIAEAKRLVEAKGLYVNNERVQNFGDTLKEGDLLDGRFVVVRSGSQKQLVLVAA